MNHLKLTSHSCAVLSSFGWNVTPIKTQFKGNSFIWRLENRHSLAYNLSSIKVVANRAPFTWNHPQSLRSLKGSSPLRRSRGSNTFLLIHQCLTPIHQVLLLPAIVPERHDNGPSIPSTENWTSAREGGRFHSLTATSFVAKVETNRHCASALLRPWCP